MIVEWRAQVAGRFRGANGYRVVIGREREGIQLAETKTKKQPTLQQEKNDDARFFELEEQGEQEEEEEKEEEEWMEGSVLEATENSRYRSNENYGKIIGGNAGEKTHLKLIYTRIQRDANMHQFL